MTAPIFPNEPIRFSAPPEFDSRYDEASDTWDDEPHANCWYCGGEGYLVCDGGTDCPEADDAGCPFVDFHTYRCGECDGAGRFRVTEIRRVG